MELDKRIMPGKYILTCFDTKLISAAGRYEHDISGGTTIWVSLYKSIAEKED